MTTKYPVGIGTNLTMQQGEDLMKLATERNETVAATLRAMVEEALYGKPGPVADRKPKDMETSYTDIGHDVKEARVYGNIIPVAIDRDGLWTFLFSKRVGQLRSVNKSLVSLLEQIGDVFIIGYSSDGKSPMKITDANGLVSRTNRRSLHSWLVTRGKKIEP